MQLLLLAVELMVHVLTRGILVPARAIRLT
jgi:hypothetical protein